MPQFQVSKNQVALLLNFLAERGIPFEFEPLPFDTYSVTTKEEYKQVITKFLFGGNEKELTFFNKLLQRWHECRSIAAEEHVSPTIQMEIDGLWEWIDEELFKLAYPK